MSNERDHRMLEDLERRLVLHDPQFAKRFRRLQAQVGEQDGTRPGDRAAAYGVSVVGGLALIVAAPEAALTAAVLAGLLWRSWRRSGSGTRSRPGRQQR